MIRIDEENSTTTDNRRDTHPSNIVRDYSISCKDRPTTQTQTTVTLSTTEHDQDTENFAQTATCSWGGNTSTTTTGNRPKKNKFSND